MSVVPIASGRGFTPPPKKWKKPRAAGCGWTQREMIVALCDVSGSTDSQETLAAVNRLITRSRFFPGEKISKSMRDTIKATLRDILTAGKVTPEHVKIIGHFGPALKEMMRSCTVGDQPYIDWRDAQPVDI